MKSLMRAGAFALVLAAGAAPAAMAQQAPSAADAMFRATTLNLSAYGETDAAPDMATISLGVMTEGATAAEAMQAYLDWEFGLVDQLARDGAHGFYVI